MTTPTPERVDIEAMLERISANELAIQGLHMPTARAWIAMQRAALTELESLRAATTWRPIAEAPKDGSTVFVYAPRAGGAPPCCGLASFVLDDWWWDAVEEDGRLVDPPTHWIPLPTPPEVTT